MPSSKTRRGVLSAKARTTRANQAKIKGSRISLKQYRRRRLAGWILVGLAAVIAVGHLAEHLTLISFLPDLVSELGLGWPTAGLLAVLGSIVLSKHSA